MTWTQESRRLFCRGATALAGFAATLAVLSCFINAPRGMPIISGAALAIAAAIWAIGWAGRQCS